MSLYDYKEEARARRFTASRVVLCCVALCCAAAACFSGRRVARPRRARWRRSPRAARGADAPPFQRAPPHTHETNPPPPPPQKEDDAVADIGNLKQIVASNWVETKRERKRVANYNEAEYFKQV